MNGLEGFGIEASGKWVTHHGVSPATFLLYLHEMQERSTNQPRNVFDLFLKGLVHSVPDVLYSHKFFPKTIAIRGREP